jgi:exonuclease VII small subunit
MGIIEDYSGELITVTVPKDFFERVGKEYTQMKELCNKFCTELKDVKKELQFYKNTSFEKEVTDCKKIIETLKNDKFRLEKQVEHFKETNKYLIARCGDLEFELRELFEDIKQLKQMNHSFQGECPF